MIKGKERKGKERRVSHCGIGRQRKEIKEKGNKGKEEGRGRRTREGGRWRVDEMTR